MQLRCSDELMYRFLQCTIYLISHTCTLPCRTYYFLARTSTFFNLPCRAGVLLEQKWKNTKQSQRTKWKKQKNNASYVYGPVFKIISQSNLGESHRNTTNLTSIMLSSDFHFIIQETNGGKWCGVTVHTKGNCFDRKRYKQWTCLRLVKY